MEENLKNTLKKKRKKERYIKLDTFLSQHEIEERYMQKMVSEKTIPSGIIKQTSIGKCINEMYFYNRRSFIYEVWDTSIENYRILSSRYTDSDIARMIVDILKEDVKHTTWNTFMGIGLYDTISETITMVRVRSKLWKFFRATTWIIRRLERNPTIRDFDGDVDSYYGFYEAQKIKKEIRGY